MPLAPAIGTVLSSPLTAWGDQYRVQVYAFRSGDFGRGALVAEVSTALNIGYGLYLNDVPEAFFTIAQDDPMATILSAYRGKGHVVIWRGDKVAFAGWFGMDYDSTPDDVIFYAIGYLGGLFFYPTDWAQSWADAQTNTIALDMWTRAQSWTNSMMAWIGVGQVQPTSTLNDDLVNITLPNYEKFYGRILFALQELAALAMSDTINQAIFEITHDMAPVFNFWKDKGSDVDLKLEWGGRYIKSFRESGSPADHRNEILAVGQDARSLLLRTSASDTTDSATFGARIEPLMFQWVRDATELERVTKRRLAMAKIDDIDLQLELFPNTLVPPGGRDAVFDLGDRISVKINRGATQIDKRMLVRGVQVLAFQNGVEKVMLMLQERPGT